MACASGAAQNDASTDDVDGQVAVVDASAADGADVVDGGAAADSGSNADGAPQPDASPNAPDAGLLDAAPPDATPPDATPPDAAPPDACVPEWIELLSNPGFESGATVWTTTTNNGATQVIRMFGAGYPWPPQTGDWAALFGGDDDVVQTMWQQFTVPGDATMLRLSGHRCFVTEETTIFTEYDTLDVELQTTSGTTLESLAHWSNLDAGVTCSWSAVANNATNSYAGQTIRLHFASDNDFSNISSFGIDALSVEALACP
jgi:hypothetical protein